MPDRLRGNPLGRLIGRLAGRHRSSGDGRPTGDLDRRLPEERLVDASAHYGRIIAGDGLSRRGSEAEAAGVRTVPATDPSQAEAPAWVRRLGDGDGTGGSSVDVAPTEARPSGAGRRPRRR